MHCSAKPSFWLIILPVLMVVVACQTVNFKKRFNYLNKVAVNMQHDMDSLSKQIHSQRELALSEDLQEENLEKSLVEANTQINIDEDMTTWQAVNQIFYEHTGFSINRITSPKNASLASAKEKTEAIFILLFILSVALMVVFIWTILSGAYFEGLGCAGCVLFFFIFAFLIALIGYSLDRI
jgi:hypothetical protein